MVCTSCKRPLSFLRRGLPIGEDVLCPDCFAEIPPQGEMERLTRYYAERGNDELLAILEKGTSRYRVYSLKAARDEILRRGGPDADRARVMFSSISNADTLESLIERHLATERVADTATARALPSDTSRPALEKVEKTRGVFLTTESAPGVPVAERLEIVSAEAAINMRGIRDFLVGTIASGEARSLASLTDLQTAKRDVLESLRRRAEELGAHAVVGITLKFEQLGAGINMMLVSAYGTAVRLMPEERDQTADEHNRRHRDPLMVPIYTFDPATEADDNTEA